MRCRRVSHCGCDLRIRCSVERVMEKQKSSKASWRVGPTRRAGHKRVRRPGIEPGASRWQRDILPLNQRRFMNTCLSKMQQQPPRNNNNYATSYPTCARACIHTHAAYTHTHHVRFRQCTFERSVSHNTHSTSSQASARWNWSCTTCHSLCAMHEVLGCWSSYQ